MNKAKRALQVVVDGLSNENPLFDSALLLLDDDLSIHMRGAEGAHIPPRGLIVVGLTDLTTVGATDGQWLCLSRFSHQRP